MEIKFICTFWGKENLWPIEFIALAKEAGYDGVEMNIAIDNQFVDSLKSSLKKENMILIGQQWLPPANESVEEYRNRMTKILRHVASLNPVFINSHTGKDYFSFEDNCKLIENCFEIEKETGIHLLHETHRGRFTHHAYGLLPYIDRYENLYFNADFSHFCTVSESLLEDQENVIGKIIPRCKYIHSRVGFDQAPQVNHPFAPEWKSTLDRFVGWWQQILDIAKKNGEKVFYICPEFGPFPYMPRVPFTQQPISSQWDINKQIMDYLKKTLVV